MKTSRIAIILGVLLLANACEKRATPIARKVSPAGAAETPTVLAVTVDRTGYHPEHDFRTGRTPCASDLHQNLRQGLWSADRVSLAQHSQRSTDKPSGNGRSHHAGIRRPVESNAENPATPLGRRKQGDILVASSHPTAR